MQSRLERKSDRQSKQVIALFIVGSFVLIGLFLYFGVPALFKLAGTISEIGKSPEDIVEEQVILNAPSLTREFQATKSAEISVKGISDPNSKVELSRNSISLGIETADETGGFIFKDIALEKGRNEFVAKTISSKGKESDPSGVYAVFYSTSGPKMELSNKDGDSVKENPYTFSGKVDPVSSTVTVNDRLAIVESNGSFSYYMTLNNGDNKIVVLATDEAGNETKQEVNLKYEP